MKDYTIVVPDQNVLSCVCGTNDSNLRLIEEHLGVPVFTKGNELSVEDEDPLIRQKFQFIVDRIIDEISAGGKNGEDIVVSVLNTHKKPRAEEEMILIPGGLKRVYARTQHQAEYINMLQHKDMVCLFIPAFFKRFSESLMGQLFELLLHIHHHNVKDHISVTHRYSP